MAGSWYKLSVTPLTCFLLFKVTVVQENSWTDFHLWRFTRVLPTCYTGSVSRCTVTQQPHRQNIIITWKCFCPCRFAQPSSELLNTRAIKLNDLASDTWYQSLHRAGNLNWTNCCFNNSIPPPPFLYSTEICAFVLWVHSGCNCEEILIFTTSIC